MTSAKSKSDVLKLFSALKSTLGFAEIKHIVPLTEEALLGEKQIVTSWSQASNWVEWWTRLPHLQMLTPVFSHENADWHGIQRNTNGVERVNQDSKQENPTSLLKAMEYLYKKDKAKALAYLAAEKQISVTYRSQTEESRRNSATSRKRQRAQQMDSDEDAQFGPPDKRSNFNKSRKRRIDFDSDSDVVPPGGKGKGKSKKTTFKGIGQRVEVRYSDGVWYKGTLVDFNVKTGSWVAKFDADSEATTIKFPDKDVRLI